MFIKYKHGGNIRKAAETYDLDENSIIDFSANINPLGMSDRAVKAIKEAIGGIVNYPDAESTCLLRALSIYHGIPQQYILAGNGATELIYLVARALRPEKALIVAPAFSEYERALVLAGCRVDHFVSSCENSFAINLNELFSVLERGYESLWLANPANPSGSLIKREEIVRIAQQSASLGITLVVDEAFIDFCEKASVKDEVVNHSNLIVLRSMTKFFALPGLRSGYLFTGLRLMSTLINYREPWTINSLAEAASIASLNDRPYVEKSRETMKREKDFLMKELGKITNMRIFESQANYLLIKLDSRIKSHYLQDRLIKEHAILIRDCSNYRGLGDGFIRVAVKGRKYNRLLVNALSSFFESNPL